MNIRILLYSLFIACFLFPNQGFTQEELILFYQKGKDRLFQKEILPSVAEMANKEGMQLKVLDPVQGVPVGIHSTPAIVFQNAKGRSIYASRYTEVQTIQNFIRVARISTQAAVKLNKKEVLVRKMGRMTVAVDLKITPIKGSIPANFDETAFQQALLESISNGANNYTWRATVDLERSDRLFYLDIHPYLDETGKVFLSTAIFSQFSCIDPIDQRFNPAFTCTLEELSKGGETVGLRMEDFLSNTLENSKIGDAWSAIGEAIPLVSWSDLDCALPPLKEAKATQQKLPSTSLAGSWRLSAPINNKVPLIQFHFMAPLERYAGEVREAKGQLSVDASGQITEGAFTVAVPSLTMGMESFDAKVLKSYLKAKRYPESSFKFQSIRMNEALQWGSSSRANIKGSFKLVGKTHPVIMNAEILPSVDPSGIPILIVQADFSLNITDLFGIKGPDGPNPAKKTLQFNLNFLMQSNQQSKQAKNTNDTSLGKL